jgi:flagellar motor switch/type III secretory pathway protein FliN
MDPLGPAVSSLYPWDALDRLARTAARMAGPARRRVEQAVSLEKVRAAIAATLASEVVIVVHGTTVEDLPDRLPPAQVELEFADDSSRLVVGLDPELASRAIARVLGRPAQLEAPGAPLGPALSGALTAIVLEVARRSSQAVALRAAPLATQRPKSEGLRVQASLLLEDRAYQAGVWVACRPDPTRELSSAGSLEPWADLTVSLPLVAGVSLARRAELASLRPGDAWSCGQGWLLDGSGQGSAALGAPAADFGVAVDVTEGGRIVLRGDRVELPVDVEKEQAMTDAKETLTEVLLEAPIVVRVEVGAVSMSVRDWTRLGPGDVIETGCRIADPVVLRVAGREVARGELVNVEGELGVRIRELSRGEPSR